MEKDFSEVQAVVITIAPF